MSYLIRVLLPDTPGSLGHVASALGEVQANIESVDVVEPFSDGTVMDDIVVDLPSNGMADEIISAVQSVDGVLVDSIRPFSGRVDRRRQIELLAELTEDSERPGKAMEKLVAALPKATTSTWAIALSIQPDVRRVAASPAAPTDDGTAPAELPVQSARILNAEAEAWVPRGWALLDASLAAAPVPGTELVVVIGRAGGPDFLPSEVTHLGHLATLCGAILT